MTWSQSDHHPGRAWMTCRLRPHHVHYESLYLTFANFKTIKLAIGTKHILIFNPTVTINRMLIDQNPKPTVKDDAC
jgi:hypothetical protein